MNTEKEREGRSIKFGAGSRVVCYSQLLNNMAEEV